MFECSREQSRPRQLLRPKRVTNSQAANGQPTNATTTTTANGSSSPSLNAKRGSAGMLNGKGSSMNGGSGFKDEVNVDSLDFTKKILHTSWHPRDNLIAIAATNNLYIYYTKESSLASNHTSVSTGANISNTGLFSNATNTTTTTCTAVNGMATPPPAVMPVLAPANANVVTDSTCLTLNTSFYTPSPSSATATSLLTSSSSSLSSCSSTNTSACLVSNNTTTSNNGSPVINGVGSPVSLAATAIPPLTTTNLMSLWK